MHIQDIYSEFGEVIKAGRESAGLTQGELATRVGLSRASIANIETGRQKVFLHQLFIFAEHLDLNVTDLLPKQSSFSSCLPSGLSSDQKLWAETILAGSNQLPQGNGYNTPLLPTSELEGKQKEWAESILRAAND